MFYWFGDLCLIFTPLKINVVGIIITKIVKKKKKE